jgi:hypothetical protein
MTEFYSCRALIDPTARPAKDGTLPARDYRITKFDSDFNVLSSYETNVHGCQCPQGHKATCRHREMLVMFQSTGHVDDGWLLDWHTRLWWEPSGDVGAAVEEKGFGFAGVITNEDIGRTLPTAPTLPHVTNPVQSESDSVARPPEVAAPIPAPSGGSLPPLSERAKDAASKAYDKEVASFRRRFG